MSKDAKTVRPARRLLTAVDGVEAAPAHAVVPQAVIVGPLVLFTTVRGVDAPTGTLASGTRAQLEQALRNVELVLQSIGGSLDDVARVVVYARDLAALRPVLDTVWTEVFTPPRPARLSVGVAALDVHGDETELVLDVSAAAPGFSGP